MDLSSPAGAAAATTEPATPTESAKSATTESTATKPASAPATTSMPANRERQENREASSTTTSTTPTPTPPYRADEDDCDERQQEQGLGRDATRSAHTNRTLLSASELATKLRPDETVDGNVELSPELACDSPRKPEGRSTVILLLKKRSRGSTELARIPVGDEAFSATSDFDATTPTPVGARLFWDDQNHHARIAHAITGLRLRAHTPLASDLPRDVGRVALPNVGYRDDRELPPRALLQAERDPIDRRFRLCRQHVRCVDDDLGSRRRESA